MKDTQAMRSNGQSAAQFAPWVAGLTAAGGGTAVLLARRARRRKKQTAAARIQAARHAARDAARGAARNLPDAARKLPDRWTTTVSEAMENKRWRTMALTGAAMTWLLFRWSEIRQLRRMNRELVARA